jgi:hypothetical protein
MMSMALKIAQAFNRKAEPFFPLLMFLNLAAFGASMVFKGIMLALNLYRDYVQ